MPNISSVCLVGYPKACPAYDVIATQSAELHKVMDEEQMLYAISTCKALVENADELTFKPIKVRGGLSLKVESVLFCFHAALAVKQLPADLTNDSSRKVLATLLGFRDDFVMCVGVGPGPKALYEQARAKVLSALLSRAKKLKNQVDNVLADCKQKADARRLVLSTP